MQSATSLMDNASVSGTEEAPFVVVPHAPDQPLAKLRALYEAIKELLFHLRKHVWHASAFSSERQFSVLNTSDYKQVRVLVLVSVLGGVAGRVRKGCLWHTIPERLFTGTRAQ